MLKSKKNRVFNNKTHSNRKTSLQKFQKEITVIFFEILLMIKLYHWKTTSYATHKATDELYSKLNENIDRFSQPFTMYYLFTYNLSFLF
jgi:DNA-binding ferritin-like protein